MRIKPCVAVTLLPRSISKARSGAAHSGELGAACPRVQSCRTHGGKQEQLKEMNF